MSSFNVVLCLWSEGLSVESMVVMALLRTVVISDVFINVVLCLWSEGLSVESMVVMN